MINIEKENNEENCYYVIEKLKPTLHKQKDYRTGHFVVSLYN